MSRFVSVVVVVLALASGVTATLHAQDGGTRVCASSEPRPGEAPMDAFVDSAMLASALAPRWVEAWGRVFATVSADSMGTPRVRILSTSSEVEGLDVVGEWVQTLARDIEPDSRVELFLGDADGYSARSVDMVMCAPRLANGSDLSRRLTEWGRERNRGPMPEGAPFTAGVWLYVSVLGTVIEYQLDEPSGWEEFDAFVRYMMLSAEFEPAMAEGIPTAVWVSIPVTFALGGQNPFRQGDYPDRDVRRRGGGD